MTALAAHIEAPAAPAPAQGEALAALGGALGGVALFVAVVVAVGRRRRRRALRAVGRLAVPTYALPSLVPLGAGFTPSSALSARAFAKMGYAFGAPAAPAFAAPAVASAAQAPFAPPASGPPWTPAPFAPPASAPPWTPAPFAPPAFAPPTSADETGPMSAVTVAPIVAMQGPPEEPSPTGRAVTVAPILSIDAPPASSSTAPTDTLLFFRPSSASAPLAALDFDEAPTQTSHAPRVRGKRPKIRPSPPTPPRRGSFPSLPSFPSHLTHGASGETLTAPCAPDAARTLRSSTAG